MKYKYGLMAVVLFLVLFWATGTIAETLCGNPCNNQAVIILEIIFGFAWLFPIFKLSDMDER